MSVEAEIVVYLTVDVDHEGGEVDEADVRQAVQDALGHTGAIVGELIDVTVDDA